MQKMADEHACQDDRHDMCGWLMARMRKGTTATLDESHLLQDDPGTGATTPRRQHQRTSEREKQRWRVSQGTGRQWSHFTESLGGVDILDRKGKFIKLNKNYIFTCELADVKQI